MHSIQKKNKAVILRRRGKSIYDVAKILGLKHTTVSYWCKNVQLSKTMMNKISKNGKLKSKAGMLLYTEKLRKARIQNIKTQKEIGAKSFGRLSRKDIYMVGLGLYWGEGYKYDSSEMGFTNSNPLVITFYLKWLSILGVKTENLIFRLSLNKVFRDRESYIKKFWIRILGAKKEQFSATTFIQTHLKKTDKKNISSYHGVLRVKVSRGSNLKHQVMGALEKLSEL